MWRHLFAAIPAAFLLILIISVARRPAPDYSRPLTEAEKRGEKTAAAAKNADAESGLLATQVMIGLGVVSAAFFFIDSMRRTYRSGNTLAIAIAFMGLITFGMASLIYYAIWGREPLRPASAIYGDGIFCERCLALSTDRRAPGTLTYNGFFGTQPMGAADRCPACTSVVRTIWLWIGIPLLPIGSYRMIATEKNHYVGRRTGMRWSQVVPVYAIALLIVWAISYAFS